MIFDRLYHLSFQVPRPASLKLSLDEWLELRADPRTNQQLTGTAPHYTFAGIPLELPR